MWSNVLIVCHSSVIKGPNMYKHHRKIIAQTKMYMNTYIHIVLPPSTLHSRWRKGEKKEIHWSGYRIHNDIFQVIGFIYLYFFSFLFFLSLYWKCIGQHWNNMAYHFIFGAIFRKQSNAVIFFSFLGWGHCHCCPETLNGPTKKKNRTEFTSWRTNWMNTLASIKCPIKIIRNSFETRLVWIVVGSQYNLYIDV